MGGCQKVYVEKVHVLFDYGLQSNGLHEKDGNRANDENDEDNSNSHKKEVGKPLISENPRVRKIRVRNSGAGNGCANFMGA